MPSDARRTYSCGACAPPPRGPSPSIVTRIAEAECAASLAPPRPAAALGLPPRPPPPGGGDGPPERRAGTSQHVDGGLAGVHRRPEAGHLRVQLGAAHLVG